MATEALYQTLSLSAKAIENLAKGNMMWPDGEAKLLSNQVLDSVVVGGHSRFNVLAGQKVTKLLSRNVLRSQSRVLQGWT